MLLLYYYLFFRKFHLIIRHHINNTLKNFLFFNLIKYREFQNILIKILILILIQMDLSNEVIPFIIISLKFCG